MFSRLIFPVTKYHTFEFNKIIRNFLQLTNKKKRIWTHLQDTVMLMTKLTFSKIRFLRDIKYTEIILDLSKKLLMLTLKTYRIYLVMVIYDFTWLIYGYIMIMIYSYILSLENNNRW